MFKCVIITVPHVCRMTCSMLATRPHTGPASLSSRRPPICVLSAALKIRASEDRTFLCSWLYIYAPVTIAVSQSNNQVIVLTDPGGSECGQSTVGWRSRWRSQAVAVRFWLGLQPAKDRAPRAAHSRGWLPVLATGRSSPSVPTGGLSSVTSVSQLSDENIL